MNYIFISTSYLPGNSVFEYYKSLGDDFIKRGFIIIFIFDQLNKNIPNNSKSIKYYSWPSKRPTNIKDFFFLVKLINKYKPSHCIATFGSVNMMVLTSFIKNVKNRIVWIRTTQNQILTDDNKPLYYRFLIYRKTFIYSLATKIIANSDGTKDDSIRTFNIRPNKIKVLFNLKKKSLINFTKKEERNNSIIIVGRLNKSKGHENLFNQFKIVLSKYPKIQLDVVGSGNLLNTLKELTVKLDIKENINFHGNVLPEQIGHFFSQSLIGISSSFNEAFGWVNIESLNEGTPIVSTETEGAKNILNSGLNGEFFYHENKYSLLNSLELIFAKWSEYSKGAIETFNSNFSTESNINKHAEIILRNS